MADAIEVDVDCATQHITVAAAGPDMTADIQARKDAAAADAAAQADAAQQRQAALDVVRAKASGDPAFAALLTLLGPSTS